MNNLKSMIALLVLTFFSYVVFAQTVSKDVSTTSSGGGKTYTLGLNTDLGGYIFYLSTTKKHGLVAETQDQSSLCNWYQAQDYIRNEANHSTNGKKFTDWRLPTQFELNFMYKNKKIIGGFTDEYYWCSTEQVSFQYDGAYIQSFRSGFQTYTPKANGTHKDYPHHVRAIRSF